MPRTRLWYAVPFCLLLLLASAALSAEGPALRVNERDVEILVKDGQAAVALSIENRTGTSLSAHVDVELLDPHDKVFARSTRAETIRQGESRVVIPLQIPFQQLVGSEQREFPWYRLRYRITPTNTGAGRDASAGAITGLVSLSEISRDLFELRVLTSEKARPGQPFRARVRTVHPLTKQPVKGVHIEGEIPDETAGDDEKSVTLKAAVVTDADGHATLDFQIPRKFGDDDEFELNIKARRGLFEETASDSIDIEREARVLITTDKPLYQPGQTLRLRALLFDASNRAVPEAEISFKIDDPEGTTAFRTDATTSRFGVATADWNIPANTRLGDYLIQIETDDERLGDSALGATAVKISRYELPNFSVEAKPDRTYYLAGQNAEVEVRADYLFGQPVKRGQVRVVRETERSWNYQEQKYVTEEGAEVRGELDSSGRFVARLDLAEEHKELADQTWSRFQDISYAAYVTDATTNRTEQRRFQLRLTREPVHLYIAEGRFDQAEGLPLAFYVSTFYPDGTPAECEVTVTDESRITSAQHAELASDKAGDRARTVLKLRTNRFGVARATGPVVRLREGQERYLSLRFSARDSEGRTGNHTDDFWLYDEGKPAIRVETDKTLYRAGEPLRVEIISNKPDLSVFVDASTKSRVVASAAAKLRDGRATLTLPYTPEFKDDVTVSAISTDLPQNEYGDYSAGTRTVVYPRDRELKLDVRTTQAVYRPGEDASASFNVRGSDGRKVESALGVVIFDKAVEERARTDQEFGSYGFSDSFYSFWYGWGNIGGVSERDIEQLDLSKPVPEGLEAVAEMLFNSSGNRYDPNIFSGTEFREDQSEIFSKLTGAQLAPLKLALAAFYDETLRYPTDEASLRRILAAAGIEFDKMLDPWGTPYRASFSIQQVEDVLELRSAGADEKFETDDDFSVARLAWPYFRPTGEKITRAVEEYHKRTGAHVRDLATLEAEVQRQGLALDSLRDRWGRPYEFLFGVSGTTYIVVIRSGGPDRTIQPVGAFSSDDFTIWTAWSDYFAKDRQAIDAALASHARRANSFPRNDAELDAALKRAKIDLTALRDGWGNPYHVSFREEKRYTDRVTVESRGQYNPGAQTQQTKQRTEVKPVTQIVNFITLRSNGPDTKPNTPDDFSAAEFSSIVAEQTSRDSTPQPVEKVTTFSGATGAISGTVRDPIDAVVAGATITVTHKNAHVSFSGMTDENGKYTIRNLPSGFYTLKVEATGFRVSVIEDVQVLASNLTKVDVRLDVSAVTETVTVSAGESTVVNASTATVGRRETRLTSDQGVPPKPQLSTPRLRENFQETLLWQPLIETDREGRAHVNFKLADNITTWKMSVIGSTADGELGTADHEFRAFQPFFVEHEPPRVLTEGDEISLPVVLRNYLERAQAVQLEIKPEAWFSLLGPAAKRAEVSAGDSSRETFDFRASASVNDGKQRITATGADSSDAIEKPVSVHPDGEEVADTTAGVFSEAGALSANVPEYTIAGSLRAELKVYPNLAAHLLESVEGILARPTGCGEQTISSAYPSVMLLRRHKTLGKSAGPGLDSSLARARRYVQIGYERLLNYRDSTGGFTYWGNGDPDLALTAYALRFLTDAREVIEVDEDVTNAARVWLLKQQRADGSWPAQTWSGEDARRTALLTAFVARVLADNRTRGAASNSDTQKSAASLQRALAYLSKRADEIDEPYLIASYALAAQKTGDREGATRATARLRTLAKNEGPATYWALETNTPFYGWGLAGRIETTALAIQALRADCGLQNADCVLEETTSAANQQSAISNPQLINRGLLFLLRNKDRYGVWLSTQATINVLDTLLALLTTDQPAAEDGTQATRSKKGSNQTVAASVAVYVNGRAVGNINLPPANRLSGPVSLDLSRFFTTGANRVEVRGAPAYMQAQLVTTYYIPWSKSHAAAPGAQAFKETNASALRLAIRFDRDRAAVTQEIVCRVEAERVGHHGYGMLLAEVGLPPGADVDRASLERTMKESGYSISRYDLLPDRLVIYLWPRGGGTKFDFKFRPRFGINALTAPSQVYDYYNPEARAVVAPTRFVVR